MHCCVLFALNKLCNQLATGLGVLFLQLYGGTVAMAIQGQQEVSEASLCMGRPCCNACRDDVQSENTADPLLLKC